jgi:hypothetical protein
MDKPAKDLIVHNLTLFLAVGFAYLWTFSASTSEYSLQLVALFAIIYIALQVASRNGIKINNKLLFDFVLLTVIVFLIVFSTGALFSPLFFLIYFLLFAIALLFEPSAAFSLAIIATIFFLLTPRREILVEILQIGSLYLIAPLANIFGAQYIKLLEDEEKIEVLKGQEKMLEDEVKRQESEVETWVSKDLMTKLASIWESVEEIETKNNLNDEIKAKLKKISDELSSLLESARNLEKKINQ